MKFQRNPGKNSSKKDERSMTNVKRLEEFSPTPPTVLIRIKLWFINIWESDGVELETAKAYTEDEGRGIARCFLETFKLCIIF